MPLSFLIRLDILAFTLLSDQTKPRIQSKYQDAERFCCARYVVSGPVNSLQGQITPSAFGFSFLLLPRLSLLLY